jgi:hypothetical protein
MKIAGHQISASLAVGSYMVSLVSLLGGLATEHIVQCDSLICSGVSRNPVWVVGCLCICTEHFLFFFEVGVRLSVTVCDLHL